MAYSRKTAFLVAIAVVIIVLVVMIPIVVLRKDDSEEVFASTSGGGDGGQQLDKVTDEGSPGYLGTSDYPSMVPSMVPSDLPSLLPSSVPSSVPSLVPADFAIGEAVELQTKLLVGTKMEGVLNVPYFSNPADDPSPVLSGPHFDDMSDTPSAVPSDVPSSAPSDLPSLVPVAWETPQPTRAEEALNTPKGRRHNRKVKALRERESS
jgi:hypothetical protein